MRKLILTFLITISAVLSFGQSECGTPSNFPNLLPTYTNETGLNDESPICVRVFFHIVRNTAGTNGYNQNQIPNLVNELNLAFNPHNILIVNSGLDFINNDVFGLEFNDGEFNALTATQNVANAVNIYLLPVNPIEYAGRAAAIPSRSLVIGSNFINTSTAPHELGHCLNLFHTHHQLEINTCATDPTTWTDCGECSDFVCDTPNDPRLACGANVNATTCEYTGGGGFNPDTRNIMSSSCRFLCRDRFTVGQGARMRTSLRFDPLLSTLVTNNCVNIQGLGNLCSTNLNTYFVQNPPAGATFVWSVNNTSVAQIQGSNTNPSITLASIGNGNIILRCDITIPTGVIFATKDIVVGNPFFVNGTFSKNGQLMSLSVDPNLQGGNFANTLCKGVQSDVSTTWPTANTVTWTGPNNYFLGHWYDLGFWSPTKTSTMKVHIFGYPTTGFWSVTGTNGCGSTTYQISFKSELCTGDPCTYYRISPNPIKDGEIIIIAKPGPIECPPILSKNIDKVNIYDLGGKIILSKNNLNATKSNISVSSNNKGMFIVEIFSGKHSEKHQIIIQ